MSMGFQLLTKTKMLKYVFNLGDVVFSMLINVKTQVVGILTFKNIINVLPSGVEHKTFITSGPGTNPTSVKENIKESLT